MLYGTLSPIRIERSIYPKNMNHIPRCFSCLLTSLRPSHKKKHSQVWNKQDSGFTISKDEQISYNQWVAELVSAAYI